jgi:hypothetical protein
MTFVLAYRRAMLSANAPFEESIISDSAPASAPESAAVWACRRETYMTP